MVYVSDLKAGELEDAEQAGSDTKEKASIGAGSEEQV
jgi:hypothetical protein